MCIRDSIATVSQKLRQSDVAAMCSTARMFLGLRSVIYPVTDLAASTAWYRSVLDVDPYFVSDEYVGFSVGGYELGLFPSGDPAEGGISYWGVTNADDALAALLATGATAHQEVHDVGDSIRMASVLDPTGTVVGIIENPHFTLAP